MWLRLALAWLILAAAQAGQAQAHPPAVWLAPGPHAVTALSLDWRAGAGWLDNAAGVWETRPAD